MEWTVTQMVIFGLSIVAVVRSAAAAQTGSRQDDGLCA